MKVDPLTTARTALPSEPFVPRLVSDTLEARLARAIADSRASQSDPAEQDEAFLRACRRDAIAVIEIGRAIGLLRPRTASRTPFPVASDAIADEPVSLPPVKSGARVMALKSLQPI